MGMFDSKPEALTSAEMAAGAGRSLGNTFGDVIPGYQSKEQQVVSIMQTVDHSDPDQVREAYNQILQVDPEAASEYLTQAKEFLDQRTKATSGDPYLAAKRARSDKAVRLQQAYGIMDSLEDKKAFKQILIDEGLGDSTVYTSITSEINTLTTAGISQEKDTDSKRQKLSEQMIKNGVPEIESALSEFEGLAAKYKGNLPGIGMEAFSPSKKAKEMSSAFSTVKNMVLKERSGAAVTNPEFQRLKDEIQGAYYTTDEDAIRWVNRVRDTLERVKGTVFSGYGDRVKSAYWKSDNAVRMYKRKGGDTKKPALQSFNGPDGNIYHTDGTTWFDNDGNTVDISKVK
jgi:hypothetical protein